MAGSDRAKTDLIELLQLLAREPHRFGFYPAVRRLEASFPDRPRLGESRRAGEDPVRLGQTPSLAFPPATIHRLEEAKLGGPPWLKTRFLGLFGPNGPLPLHLTEYALDRINNHHDRTLERFVDMFHHRMLSLFYRAWASAQPAAQHDRRDEDRFQQYVGSVCGLGSPSFRHRDRMPYRAKLHNAGLLAGQTRSAEGLAILIENFFEVPTKVQQFVGRWLSLPAEDCTRLGGSSPTARLGMSTILGSRVWECHQKFRVVFGPLSYEEYLRLLPRSESMERLKAVVRNYVGFEFAWDVRLLLREEEVQPTRLGGGQRLGWTTWAVSREGRREAGALVFEPDSQSPFDPSSSEQWEPEAEAG